MFLFFSYFQGLLLGLSLIIAIGAQNLFVFNQGLIGKHIFLVCLFCSISDTFLILIGYLGIYIIINDNIFLQNLIIFLGFIWLLIYGILKIRYGLLIDKNNFNIYFTEISNRSLTKTLFALAGITWFNPHVYLDTVFLIGSISNSIEQQKQIPFLIGCMSSSFLFFFLIGYLGFKIGPLIKTPIMWKKINILFGIIMIILAFYIIFKYFIN
ncbi:MAG: LysE/ArgO family amino acid transporter [Paracoccaceae bacterium]